MNAFVLATLFLTRMLMNLLLFLSFQASPSPTTSCSSSHSPRCGAPSLHRSISNFRLQKSGTNNDYFLKSLNFRFPLGPERPPQPGEVPGDWRALQLEGVRRCLPVQRGNQDEPRAQVRGLVVETSKSSSSSWSSPPPPSITITS